MPRAPSQHSLDTLITRVIKNSPPGTVFTTRDFLTMGNPKAVAKCLERLIKRKQLRWLSRGIYDKPRHDEVLGLLWPSLESVIKVIIDKNKIRVQPSGVYAANLLGLSEQVPAKIVLLTDGSSRTVKAGPMRIILKRTTPRNLAASGRFTGLLIQAFKSLGAKHIETGHIERLKKTVPKEERLKLLEDMDLAPAWMHPLFLELAERIPWSRSGKKSERNP